MSPNKSYTSASGFYLELPEVKNLTCEFVYNYYTPDEMIPLQNNQSQKINFITFDKEKGTYPRYVDVRFQPPDVRNFTQAKYTNFIGNKLEQFLSQINNEEQVSSNLFGAINFQDVGLEGKLYLLASGTFNQQMFSLEKELSKLTPAQKSMILGKIKQNELSSTDKAKILNLLSSENLDIKFFENAIGNLNSLGITFKNENILKNSNIQYLQNTNFKVKVNNKFGYDLLNGALNDPLSQYSEELYGIINDVKRRQEITRGLTNVNQVQNLDYVLNLENADLSAEPGDSNFDSRITVVGYLVQKIRIESNDVNVSEPPILLIGKDHNAFIDVNVTYGYRYLYYIRTILELRQKCLVENEGATEQYIGTFLLASEPSEKVLLYCANTTPPLPPQDIRLYWEYKQGHPILIWDFPRNTTKNIKRFQIFRRKAKRGVLYRGQKVQYLSPEKQPFELIQEIDFSDAVKEYIRKEAPDKELITKSSYPVKNFTDKDFNIGDEAIYTICCIDAQGLSSNYSTQYYVRFDTSKNELVVQVISDEGAPKAYPNIYLKNDLIENVLKDSNHSALKVYFHPECYDVTHGFTSGDDKKVPIVKTDKLAGYYVIDLINTDNHKHQQFKIVINDKRTLEK